MSAFNNVEILIVEDNPYDAEMTMRTLRKANFHHKTYWARDGVDALAFLRCTGDYAARDPRHRLKLILLDLKMPRLNGLDVLRELKSVEKFRNYPVVMMTSSNEDRDIAECYRLGANGYVTKPVQYDEFNDTVSKMGTYWLTINKGAL